MLALDRDPFGPLFRPPTLSSISLIQTLKISHTCFQWGSPLHYNWQVLLYPKPDLLPSASSYIGFFRSCRVNQRIVLINIPHSSGGAPRWLSGRESTCQCRRCGLNSWAGKIPWRRKWQPTLLFLSGTFHGQRSRAGWVRGVAGSWTWLSKATEFPNRSYDSTFLTVSPKTILLTFFRDVRFCQCPLTMWSKQSTVPQSFLTEAGDITS